MRHFFSSAPDVGISLPGAFCERVNTRGACRAAAQPLHTRALYPPDCLTGTLTLLSILAYT